MELIKTARLQGPAKFNMSKQQTLGGKYFDEDCLKKKQNGQYSPSGKRGMMAPINEEKVDESSDFEDSIDKKINAVSEYNSDSDSLVSDASLNDELNKQSNKVQTPPGER